MNKPSVLLTKKISKDVRNKYTAIQKGELIQADTFFIGHKQQFLILVDTFSRYIKVYKLTRKADYKKMHESFISFIETLNISEDLPQIKILTDKGKEFSFFKTLVTNRQSNPQQIEPITEIRYENGDVVPIKWLTSTSRYGAAVAEANIGQIKQRWLATYLDNNYTDKQLFSQATFDKITDEMNAMKKQSNYYLVPNEVIDADFDEASAVEKRKESKKFNKMPEIIPHELGDLVLHTQYGKYLPNMGKRSLTPNFSKNLKMIVGVKPTPTGTYRYTLRYLFVPDSKFKAKGRAKPKTAKAIEKWEKEQFDALQKGTDAPIVFQHNELIKLNPTQVEFFLRNLEKPEFDPEHHLKEDYEQID